MMFVIIVDGKGGLELKDMVPRIRVKDRYSDGRKRYIIEYLENGKIRTCILPKPEVLLDLLKSPEKHSVKEDCQN